MKGEGLPPGQIGSSSVPCSRGGSLRVPCSRPVGRGGGRCQLVSASPASASSLSRISFGLANSRVWRGRSLRRNAMLSRSGRVWVDGLVPLGGYWRRRPLVFSLLPRCHGLRGIAEEHRDAGGHAEPGVAGHLGALAPRSATGAAEPAAGPWPGARQHGDAVGVVVVGNALENKETTGAFDQGDDRRPVGRPHDQVALPVPWHRPVGGLGRPVGSGSCPGSPPARWSSPAAGPGPPGPCRHGADILQDALSIVRGPGSTGPGRSSRPTPASLAGRGTRAPVSR